jgi:RNA 2',3'-cyclic 3'-phosphodiesterase
MTADNATDDRLTTRATPRLFIAVPLGEEARAAVASLVDGVRSQLVRPEDGADRQRKRRSDIRWVRMEGLHLTLRFLGPTPVDQVAALASVVDSAAAAGAPFGVEISGGGAFPSATKPRTLWLGITDGQDDLTRLADRLSGGLTAAGWPTETRPFRGHLTLGRSDGMPDGRKAVSLLADAAATFKTRFEAERLVLYESITGGGPARYEPVHEAWLEGR